MKNFGFSNYTLSAGLATALAGCAASQSPIVTPAATPAGFAAHVTGLGRLSSDTSLVEVLTATQVKITMVKGDCRQHPPVVDTWNFRTSGTASGDIAGTFTAAGAWSYSKAPPPNRGWGFVESFTIYGTHQYFGTISAGSPQPKPGFSCKPPTLTGPITFRYWIASGHGKAKIDFIKANGFRERLFKPL
jgi:hypothetical protein